ncbi:MAG TPA: transporter substrate-binding domain-containing protein [Noviherbaspirillum sp.]|nr:transporter substrate-binding domain-containing protein [Noviherbaspirillum sp.]
MRKFLVYAFLALLAPHAPAKEFTVNTADIPPFCHEQDGKQGGLAVDLLREAAKATGATFNFRFLAWKRAQAETQSASDQLIIPLTRTPEREKSYQWIAPLASYHFVIATRGDRPPPRTLEAAKKLAVGVLRGNPMEIMLPRMGFSNIKPGYTEEALAKLLLGNRIDAWVVADIVAKDVYKKAGGDPGDLHFGPKVGDQMWIYLGASLQFPEADRKLLADELNRLRNNGEAEKIINRYRSP